MIRLPAPALALLLAAGAASAAPFGGEARSPAPAHAVSAAGLRIAAPVVLAEAGGARVHGAVCRTSTLPPAGLAAVRIERRDGAGRVTGMVMARVSRALTGREGGCGVYDGRTDWRLTASDRVEVCAAGGGACPAT